jgi:hypothetical protein
MAAVRIEEVKPMTDNEIEIMKIFNFQYFFNQKK